jgi:hypothetical protein
MKLSYRLNSLDKQAIRIMAPPIQSSNVIASPIKPDTYMYIYIKILYMYHMRRCI